MVRMRLITWAALLHDDKHIRVSGTPRRVAIAVLLPFDGLGSGCVDPHGHRERRGHRGYYRDQTSLAQTIYIPRSLRFAFSLPYLFEESPIAPRLTRSLSPYTSFVFLLSYPSGWPITNTLRFS
jgi:hypothetical protein